MRMYYSVPMLLNAVLGDFKNRVWCLELKHFPLKGDPHDPH